MLTRSRLYLFIRFLWDGLIYKLQKLVWIIYQTCTRYGLDLETPFTDDSLEAELMAEFAGVFQWMK